MKPRLIFRDLLEDFTANIINFELPVLATGKELTLRPGQFIRDYISGKRAGYAAPIRYYVIIAAVFYLLFYWLDMGELSREMVEQSRDGFEVSGNTKKWQERFDGIMYGNLKFITIVLIPITAVFTRLFFRKAGFNFVEHLVVVIYSSAHTLLIGLLLIPVTYAFSVWVSSITILISMIYTIWVFVVFFQEKRWLGMFKTLAAFVLSYLVFVILVSIALMLFMVIFEGMG